MAERGPHPDFEALVAGTPGLGAALSAVIDRRERSGHLPRSLTLEIDPAAEQALRRLFTARAVASAGERRVRLNLGLFLRASRWSETELEDALYRALGRRPGDSTARTRALCSELEQGLATLQREARRDGSRAFVLAELRRLSTGDSELAKKAAREGLPATLSLVRDVVRCIDGLAELHAPIRVQNFAARVLGSSKALRPGGELHRWLGGALVDHDPPTRRALDEQGVPPHRSTEVARALEVNDVYLDEAAASVLCFGSLVYAKRGRRFDQVARHSELGESSRLIVQQLRDAVFERPAARRVTVFENLTPYLDYVDACVERGRRDEVVLCSGGQASWAVVGVLCELARHGMPVRHSGDLDRSGVLILRSLKRRSGARIEPMLMDAATHARFADRGKPLEAGEAARLERLLETDSPASPCHALLRAVARSGVWIEQEQFADELFADCFE
jgi:hypothetical protein